jgi:UDP-N-acetylglucosamine/UDP-N-acetylgalactosamine diphosphorylase
MLDRKSELRARLEPHGQCHVLRFWDQLSDAERDRLAAEILDLDLPPIMAAFRGAEDANRWSDLAARATGPTAVRLDGQGSELSREAARELGEEVLRAGKVGVILVAGGQGSRLGFPHPKGMYPLGPVSKRSLFQMLIERLRAVAARYGVAIPLYLMTSPATHEETVRYLETHRWFGLPEADVHIFCQGTLPALDANTGQLLLAEKGRLFLAPDGHGGMLRALEVTGGLEDAGRRGVEHLFYGQIDNPLIQVGDPVLLGHHLAGLSEVTTQVVCKRAPLEPVGNVVNIDGKVQIIEYSDLPPEIARRKRPDGSLELWAGNLAVHIFELAFLRRMVGQADALPLHRAFKQTPHINERGDCVRPDAPNAYKFERFIFDLLPRASRALAVEADKCEAFAPVKRGTDADHDTPDTSRRAMVQLHTRWLEQAGATIAPGVSVEISPLWALDAGEVRGKLAPGTVIDRPMYFH